MAVYSTADRAESARPRRRSRRGDRPRDPAAELPQHRAAGRGRPDSGCRRGAPGLWLPRRARRLRRGGRAGGTRRGSARRRRHPRHGRQDRGAPPHAATPACRSCPARSAPIDELGAGARRSRASWAIPVHGEGRGRRRRQGHAGGARRRQELPGALESAACEARKAFGDAERVPREVHPAAAPRGDPGPGRRQAAPCTSASASARSSGGTRSWSRRRRRSRSTPELREWMGAAAVAAAEAVGYRGRRHLRVPARARPVVLLPRDEHPDPGRASGHRAGLRRGPGARAAPHRRRRAACGCPQAGSARAAGRSSAASPARIRPTVSCPRTGRIEYLRVPGGPGVRWDGGVEVGRRGHAATTTRCSPSSSSGRPTARRPSTRMRRALDELAVARRGHQPGLPPPAAGRSGLPGRATSTSSSSTVAPTCWPPSPRADDVLRLAVAAALAEDDARAAAAPGGLGRTMPRERRLARSAARLEGLR